MPKLPRLPKPPRLKSLPTKPRAKSKLGGISKRASTNSHIDTVSYSPETRHLTVTFQGGRSYRYEGVDQDTAGKVGSASSPGTALHAHVIGKFPHTKI